MTTAPLPAFPGRFYPGTTWPGFLGDSFDYQPVPRSLTDLLAGSHRRLVRATIVGGPLDGTDLPITAGSLAWEYAGRVRLSGSLTVAALPEWTRLDVDATLHPDLGTEIHLAGGVRDDTGTDHWWDYGIVRPTSIDVTTAPDAIEVACRVMDRGGILAVAKAPKELSIPVGTGVLAGIRDALAQVAPWLPVDLPISDDEPATTDIRLAERPGDDLWARCQDVAHSLGRLLHVDATGTVVAPMVTMPSASDPIDVPRTAWSAGIDHEKLIHQVSADWEESRPDDGPQGWEPDGGRVTVRDPASDSLPAHVPIRTRQYSGDSSVLTSESRAHAAVTAQLADALDDAVSGSGHAVPHPDLVPGAIVADDDDRRYRITRLDIDLSGMSPVGLSLGNTGRSAGSRLAGLLGYGGTVGERTEVVTDLEPFMSRPLAGEDVTPLTFTPSDALAGLVVGDVIRVVHDGMGRRVGTAILTHKSVAQKFAGQSLGSVGGRDIRVGENAQLRVRIGSGSQYVAFSGGDVTLPTPAAQSHQHRLPTFSVPTPGSTSSGAVATNVTHGGFDQPLRVAYNALRDDLMGQRADLTNVANALRALSNALTSSAP